LPAFTQGFIVIGSAFAAGIAGLLVSSARESWLGVFKLYEIAVFLLISCATIAILAGKLAVAAFLTVLRLDEKTKDVFVKLKEYEDSLPALWFFVSRVPVTAGNNTGHQAGESEDTLELLSNFIRFRVATCSTIAIGIASLLVSTTVTWLCVSEFDEGDFFSFYCATAGIFVGFVVGALVARWAVANFFSTFRRYTAPTVANANAAKRAKDARRKDDRCGRIFLARK
jgi:MFS family permease